MSSGRLFDAPQAPRREPRRGPRHVFAKRVVLFCVAVGFAFSTYALIAQAHGADMAGLMGVILAFFGGELMLVCLKRIFADDKKGGQNGTDGHDTDTRGPDADY